MKTGIGGDTEAYVLSEDGEDAAWRRLAGEGRRAHIEPWRDYAMQLTLDRQRLRMEVESIRLSDHVPDAPPSRQQVSLVVWGNESVEFGIVEFAESNPTLRSQ